MEEFIKLVEDILCDLESVSSIDYKKDKLQHGKYQIKLSMIIDKSMIERNKSMIIDKSMIDINKPSTILK